ncbi:hypothetical protein MMC17_000169 [Xylographa soralifera]|nr:hypothetical protein [Xylographa soralifera]
MGLPYSSSTILPADWLTIVAQIHGLWNRHLAEAATRQRQLHGTEHLIYLQETSSQGDMLTETANIVVKRILAPTPGSSVFEFRIIELSSPMIVYIGAALSLGASPSQAQWAELRQHLDWWCTYNPAITPGRACYCIGAIGGSVRFWLYTTMVFAPQSKMLPLVLVNGQPQLVYQVSQGRYCHTGEGPDLGGSEMVWNDWSVGVILNHMFANPWPQGY